MKRYLPGIIVPAYSDPTKDWREWSLMAKAASKLRKRLIVIANPQNGPGLPNRHELVTGGPDTAIRKDYAAKINKLRQLGAKVIGYVYTCHGANPGKSRALCPRPAGSIEHDVQHWFDWYAVDGIFFDQASRDTNKPNPTKAQHLAFYTNLYRDVQMKQPGALVVLNFGCFPESSAYSQIGPLIQCVHENKFAPTGKPSFLQWTFDPNLAGQDPMACAVLLHHTDNHDLPAAVAQAKANKIGWYFVTDGQAPNPWRHLPGYFWTLVLSV